MTILTVKGRSDYAQTSNQIIRFIRQRGSDTAIVNTISSHLEENYDAKSLKMITLLNKLRHQHTNYDGCYSRVLGRGKSEQYGQEHHEVTSLINECFMEHIVRVLRDSNIDLRRKNNDLKVRLKNEQRKALKNQEDALKLAKIKKLVEAALLSDGCDKLDDLLLELACE